MLTFASKKGVKFCDGLSRRDFLRVGALSAGAVGLSLADLASLQALTLPARQDINCIILFLVGGPSQLDTWDLKPEAPEKIRGPFRPIPTNVPGIQIAEHFPLMAKMAERYTIVRSVHHDAAPIHETGHQLMQTGYLSGHGQESPHYGSVVSYLRGPKQTALPPFVVLPGPIDNTGVSVGHGQTAGFLGPDHDPVFMRPNPPTQRVQIADSDCSSDLDPARVQDSNALVDAVDQVHRLFDANPDLDGADRFSATAYQQILSPRAKTALHIAAEKDDLRSRYGWNTFGQSCLLARRLVEGGVRLVTVNMFDTVFNEITWDCHADGGSLATSLEDYKQTLCPMFDRAYTNLLEDLQQRGMLRNTLVVAMGEFGRTPHLNPRGGRDHWPGVWSILFAGAGVNGGRVIGASDATGSEPKDRPVTPADAAATIYKGIGIDLRTHLPNPDGRTLPITAGEPIHELFGA
jgi:hypothetical protein